MIDCGLAIALLNEDQLSPPEGVSEEELGVAVAEVLAQPDFTPLDALFIFLAKNGVASALRFRRLQLQGINPNSELINIYARSAEQKCHKPKNKKRLIKIGHQVAECTGSRPLELTRRLLSHEAI